MKSKIIKAQMSTKEVAASIALVARAHAPFANTVRLTAIEKMRAAKLKRGAQQVIPTIAQVASKFAVEVPGMSIAEMNSNVAYAQSLEPLLGAVSAFLETLRDEYLRANASAWTTATVTYAMLRKAGKANLNVANELAPAQKWFRQNNRGPKAAIATTTAPVTSPETSASTTKVVTAPKTNGAADGATVNVAPATPATTPANGTPATVTTAAN